MNKGFESNINKYLEKLKSFKYIAWFLCLFLIFELIWKLCVHQGVDEKTLFVFGKDLTFYTEGINLWTAQSIHWFMHDVLNYEDFKIFGTTLYFPGSIPIEIVWGCTGIKQLLMFSFILVFYFGPVKKKMWYIPLSLVILTFINILRLSIIFIIIKEPFPEWFISVNEWYNDRMWSNTQECYYQFYKDWYNVFHKDILTFVYYDGVIFILWLVWEEKIRKAFDRIKNKPEITTDTSNPENLPPSL